MGTKVYIGNLYLRVTKQQLKQLFMKYGEVKQVDMVEGTGYGYVEMVEQNQAEKARQSLDGTEFLERVLSVRIPGQGQA
jgi:RNA recognition motif-containing protein